MAEAVTMHVDFGETSSLRKQWSADERFVRVSPIHTRAPVADLELEQALAAFDRASSWEESREAQRRLLMLRPEVVPSVLEELAAPQPPDRFDVLLALLVRWEAPEQVIGLVRSPHAGPTLRAALSEALARYLDGEHGRDARLRERVAIVLAELARDRDSGVRITAIEALGLAGLAADPRCREVLRGIAFDDESESVRAEARAVLEASD